MKIRPRTKALIVASLAAAMIASSPLAASATVVSAGAKNCSTLTVGVSSTGSFGGWHTVYSGPAYSTKSWDDNIIQAHAHNTVFSGWHSASSSYANRSGTTSAFIYCN